MSNALNKPEIRWLYAGDCCWMIEFSPNVDRAANVQVRAWANTIANAQIDGLQECVPAFGSLSVFFDPLVTDHETLRAALALLPNPEASAAAPARRWCLPCCYHPSLGWDLEDSAAELSLTPSQLVEAHSGAVFFAYALGFMPGFAYMGGLPEALALPRLASPRAKVPASSVAVTGTMAGVYPFDSPGGWRILGRTPLAMFLPARTPSVIIEAGDEVQFTPISLAEFAALQTAPPAIESLAL